MKKWLQLPFSLLALLAMLATMMPGTAWACPMTGRVDVASRVCQSAMPLVDGTMPCAGSGSKCCKPVSVPPSQSDDETGKSSVFAATGQVFSPFSFVLPALDAPSAVCVVPRIEAPPTPSARFYVARFNNSPPPLWTQFRSRALAGRAPPSQ